MRRSDGPAVTLQEIDPLPGGRPLTGRLVKVTLTTAHVEVDPSRLGYARSATWTIPLDRKTGLPPNGAHWAWKADPAELARAAKEIA